MIIRLRNNLGIIKECKVGFSWTNFFFGFFCPLLRGDWKYLFIMLLASLLTKGISWLIFPFFYNKLYINNLLQKGYYPLNEFDRNVLVEKGFIVANI